MFCLPCLFLIFYFIILGIFIPSKRKFIKDAIKCFWNKLTLQHCTDSFDMLMHIEFTMWLSENNYIYLSKFFKKKRNFDIFIIIIGFVFTVINILLFYLLYRFLFIKSPCNIEKGICLYENI